MKINYFARRVYMPFIWASILLKRRLFICGVIFFMNAPAYAGWMQDTLIKDCSRNNEPQILAIKILLPEFDSVGQQFNNGKITAAQAADLHKKILDDYLDYSFQKQKDANETAWKDATSELREILNLSFKLKQAAILKTLPLLINSLPSDTRINRIFSQQCEAIARSF